MSETKTPPLGSVEGWSLSIIGVCLRKARGRVYPYLPINIFKYSISNYDVPRTHLTHILEKLIHKMERPTKKRAVGF